MSTSPWVRRFPAWLVGVVLGFTGCRTSPPPALPPPPPIPGRSIDIPVDAVAFEVVPERSLLQILVFRGGPMARLGHNHVIASRDLSGLVHVSEDLSRTRFDIRMPVDRLTIDEPALRLAAGPEFPAEVPQNARDGTRQNLLSPALLDATQHPHVSLRALGARVTSQGYEVDVEVTLKARVTRIRVPLQVERRAGELLARGEFALRQSQLGLQPFSVAMGTLVVLDEMRVRFEITARQAQATPAAAGGA
jgi:polyisoprenoid-binding protein YceI